MLKPSLFDSKYSKLDMDTRQREYERDLMLWKQTEALQEANELREQQLNNNAEYEYELQRSKNRETQLQRQIDDLQSQLDDVQEEEDDDGETYIPNDTTNLEIQLALQLNINYLLVKKLYKLINRYGSKSPFLKQLLLTWIDFRQTHYDYDYEAFLDEFEYDKVITNRYETTHFPITPKTNGTKEEYETMIKKMIKAILNDETYDPNDINNKNLFK